MGPLVVTNNNADATFTLRIAVRSGPGFSPSTCIHNPEAMFVRDVDGVWYLTGVYGQNHAPDWSPTCPVWVGSTSRVLNIKIQ